MADGEGERGGHRFIVDHLENGFAVGQMEDGERLDLPLRLLPDGVREGDVLVFQSAGASGDRVVTIRVDTAATAARASDAARRLDRLRGEDPGRDLDL